MIKPPAARRQLEELGAPEELPDDGFADVETVEKPHSPPPEVTHKLKGEASEKVCVPDSVYASIDALRAIAVFFMVVKNAVGRFTLMSNPLAKALGADWIPPVFVFAAGARLVAEQEKLKETLAAIPRKSASYKRTVAEAFVKAYTKNIMVCPTARPPVPLKSCLLVPQGFVLLGT